MPFCDPNVSAANRQRAIPMVGSISYHTDISVVVVSSDPSAKTITFTARGTNGLVTCTASWGDLADMWAPCPSELAPWATPDDPGDPPTSGTGLLYLSAQFVTKHGLVASRPPKWPVNLPGDGPYNQLSIRPKHLRVTVEVMAGATSKDVVLDLLDPKVAEPGQTLVLGDQQLHLWLAEGAFSDLDVAFGPPAEEWPWNELVSSVAVAKDPESDLNALAHAWTIIALCIGRSETESKASLITDDQASALLSVLPDHPIIRGALPNPE